MAEWTPKTGRALSMEPPPAALRGEEDPPAAPAAPAAPVAWAPKTGRALPADSDAEPKHGITTSMIRSASDMVMPFTDEIAGAAGAGLNALASVPKRVLSADFRGMGDNMVHDYRYIRDAARRDKAEGEEEHPVATTIAKGAGLALGALAPLPGLKAGAGASAAARYAAGAGTAAGYGALNALGASDAADLSGNLKDAAIGGATGAVLHGVGQGAGALLGKVRGTMARFAALRADKAGGATGRDIGRAGLDESVARGEEMLRRGAVKFGDRTEDVAKRLETIRPQVGAEVGGVVAELDAARTPLRPGPRLPIDISPPEVTRVAPGIPEPFGGRSVGARAYAPPAQSPRAGPTAMSPSALTVGRGVPAPSPAVARALEETVGRGRVPPPRLDPEAVTAAMGRHLPDPLPRGGSLAPVTNVERLPMRPAAEAGTMVGRPLARVMDTFSGRPPPVAPMPAPAASPTPVFERPPPRAAPPVSMATTAGNAPPSRIGTVVGRPSRALPGGGVTPAGLADRIEREVLPSLQLPAHRAAAAKVAAEAALVRAMGKEPMTFDQAAKLKFSYDKMAKWNALQPPEAQAPADAMRDFQGVIRRAIDEEAQRVSPALLAKYQAARRSYSLLKPAEEIAEKRAGQLEGNRWMSPSDYGVGAIGAGAGMLTGGPIGSVLAGAATGFAHKVLRERGAASVAVTVDALQKAIASGALGKFGDRLSQAVSRGISLPVAHALLLKADPAYGQAVEQAMGGVN